MDSLWIILTGAVVAGSCGLLGCFLVLRRLSLLGDAISHAILPGIVIAFMITHRISSIPMFVGAAVLGLLTTFLVQTLSRSGVQGDAAMGVTFTALFAVGVVLISSPMMRGTDLDADCVLFGEIALTPLNPVIWGGREWGPQALWISGGLLAVNLAILGAFYKEFKICAFDPEMAAAVGINVAGMHYLLMGLVSVTTVGAFESVGAILVVAMLIVPGATAYLLTERLERMLALAVAIGALSAVTGYFLAQRLNASIGGAMTTMAGAFFLTAFLFSPRHGLVAKRLAQRRLSRRVADEDVLLWAARRAETEPGVPFPLAELARGVERLPADCVAIVARLAGAGLLRRSGEAMSLSETGSRRAVELLRRHRLYESYLGDLGYPTDHLHAAADRVEHHLDAVLTAGVAEAARHPDTDPQGKPIPRGPAAG
jgi:manganese/zinc/iron transport system permease protein